MCTSFPAFTIMTPTDIGSQTFGDTGLVLVPDPGPPNGRGAVHVSLITQMNSNWFIRSINDMMSGSPLGPLITYAGSPACTQNSDCQSGLCNLGPNTCVPLSFYTRTGWAVPGMNVHFQGYLGSGYGTTVPAGLGEFTIAVDSNEWLQPTTTPSVITNPVPPDCGQGVGNPGKFALQGGSSTPYALSCNKQNIPVGMADSSLWIGAFDGNMPVEVAQGMKNDPLMNPMLYTKVSGESFVTFQSNGTMTMLGTGTYSYGPSASALTTMWPLVPVANESSVALGLAPLTTNDGFVLIAAALNSVTADGSLWVGPVKTADFPMLTKTPPPTLKKVFAAANVLTELGGLGVPQTDPNYIWVAGPTFDQRHVMLNWFKRDGTPILMEWPVYTAPSTNGVVYAAAAPMGLATIVVWLEQLPGSMWQLTGQKLICQQM
jgi:hypothetical protein